MKSLHILHSEAATGWGGQEIRVFQECRLLLKKGHRVSVICQPGSPLAERCAEVPDPGFTFFPVRMPRSWSPGAWVTLRRLIRRVRPDILHTHSSVDSWLVSLVGRQLKIPIVRSRHVSVPVKNRFPTNWLYARFPERILTSGEAISNLITQLDGVRPEKVVSISAGVDLDRFDFKISGDSIRKELNLGPDQPLIGKIGVIRGWKGHDYLLDAVPLIRKGFPNARFVLAGTGPGFEEIRRKVGERGLEDIVTLLGHREDVPEIMAALDVLVLASFAGEGTPQVIPQAFAMKVPVVATRVASVPSLLGGGERGVLVEARSGPSLAEGVLRILRNRGQAGRQVENAYAYCRDHLTAEQMIDRTLAVYFEILEPPPAEPASSLSQGS